MTDTEVRINGISAGEIHKGGFSPFRYDISDKMRFGDNENILDVTVSKESSDSEYGRIEFTVLNWDIGIQTITIPYLERRLSIRSSKDTSPILNGWRSLRIKERYFWRKFPNPVMSESSLHATVATITCFAYLKLD